MDVRRRLIGGFVSGSSGGNIEPIDTDDYLTIYALEDGLTASLSNNACEYCIDGDGNWLSLDVGATTQSINNGQRLSFRGELTPSGITGIGTFTISKRCNLEGNCMSMLFGDNASDNLSLSNKKYAFIKLFYQCSNIVTVSENFLPVTTISDSCYSNMFSGCSNLTSAPALPATTLANGCYQNMFSGCTSLTAAPALPATTLAASCYLSMFSGCAGLTSAPALPSTTLISMCYLGMFMNCTSLTSTPALPATTLISRCYEQMFSGCTSLTAAPALPATTLADYCYYNMFYGCTSLTSVPTLPATTLTDSCYYGMFQNCSSLTNAPELLATTLASSCYRNMFRNCTNLTSAPELPATTLASLCYFCMFQDCTKLKYIKMLATDISASNCLGYWVNNVASTGTFVKHPSMTSLPTGADGIPTGWTVIDNSNGSSATDNYLTIYALEDDLTASLSTNACEYCVDGDGNWKSLSAGTATESINAGHRLSFRGNLTPKGSVGIGTFTISKRCNLEGNCMSMLFGDNAANNLSLNGKNNAFYQLFYNCANIVSVSSNFLPATTLAYRCYENMFSGCSSLTTAPELPATAVIYGCYISMFSGCTSLTTAPELPATKCAQSCYHSMFQNCTSLTTAPELPAITLEYGCYYYMFSGCTSLTTAPELPATKLDTSCYEGMFKNCTSLTTPPTLPATTVLNYCYQAMFYNCSSLTTAPELPATALNIYCYASMFSGCSSLTTPPTLPATTLSDNCYQDMFNDCTSLTTAPALPATTLADVCYSSMFENCTSLTTAPELPATVLTKYCYSSMFYGCNKLNYIKMFATNISASVSVSACLNQWVEGVASTGTFVKHPKMTSLPTGVNGIPTGWTIQDDYTPTTCTSLTITADNVSGRDTTTTIYYTAVTNGKDSNNNTINNVTITGTATSASFAQNTSTTNTVQRTISYTYLGKTATTTITQGVWVDSQYTIDLNNQWQKSTTVSNPDASEYDGVYESFSNYNINNTAAIMKITIDGYSNFKFYIRSNAESNYDYVMVSQLDQTINNSTSYSNTTLVKAHTRANQQSGTALSNYTPVEFTNIDGGKHVITIVYRKDSSANSGTDRGYVLLPKSAGESSSSGGSGGSVDINNYLTIVALEDGLTASLSTNACEYCIDGNGNWLSLAAGATTQSINTGQSLSFRGNLTPNSSTGIGTFTISKKCNLEGNCMSMLFGDNAPDNRSLNGKSYAFYNLFNGCTTIVEVSEGFLPATTLAIYCYADMFSGCYNLTTAPELPATTLANYCYRYMFEICNKLNYIKMLATDISAPFCLYDWVFGVASTGTFVKHPSMTTLSTGVSGIPEGWTVIKDGDTGDDNNLSFPLTFNLSDAVEINDDGGCTNYHFTPTNITQQLLEYLQSCGLDFNASAYAGSEIFLDEGLISVVGDAIIDGACDMISAYTSEAEPYIYLCNASGMVEVTIAKDNSYVYASLYM